MSIYVADLLPYDISKKRGTEIKNCLNEYQMILSVYLDSLHALKSKDMHRFDPLVGENACEVRAIWISIMMDIKIANSCDRLDDIINNVLSVQSRIRVMMQSGILKIVNNGISLREFLERENLLIELNRQDRFLFQAFLLTEVKLIIANEEAGFVFKEKCDPKKLKRFGDVSAGFRDNLLSKFRRAVAAESVCFAREAARATQDEMLIKMLSEDFTVLHNNYLLCTPKFWTYKAVLLAAHREEIPLIIYVKFLRKNDEIYEVVDKDYMFFVTCENGYFHVMQEELKECDYDKVGCVIQGVIFCYQDGEVSKNEWRRAMLECPIVDIILAGAADHRQYPDLRYEEKIHFLNDIEYKKYRLFAEARGISRANPTTFFIQHVYPSLIRTVLEEKILARA